ncbi:uncharacterized protein LOC122377867, partial [Amphibalanus amphitrite]|uniref:uncharacterized protein LOC122377867 n=1 Tax=Amphibalanus amphitrite TaxID=1232801 RepID=UPI001C91AF83
MADRLMCCALVLALCRVTVSLPEVSAQNEEKCEQLCVKNQGRGSNLETSCDESCRLEQCNKGCAGRNRSLESSCKQFCMDEGPSSQQGELFRVLWAVDWASKEPLPGAPSPTDLTLARGRPASAEAAVAAPDAHHVSLRCCRVLPGGPLGQLLLVVRAGGQ